MRIVRNCAMDTLRKQKSQVARHQDEQLRAGSIADPVARAELDAALRAITPDHREPFLLIEVFGLSYAEAADVLGIRVGTVKSRMHRARAGAVPGARRRRAGGGPVNCDRAQAAISERMDGERLPGRVTTAVDAHLDGCADAGRSSRARLERPNGRADPPRRADPRPRRPDHGRGRAQLAGRAPVPPTPLRSADVDRRADRRRARGRPRRGEPDRRRAVARPSVELVGLRGQVITAVRVAARTVQAYHAVFTITQRGLAAPVPERTLQAELWFSAPGRYRLDVRDRTHYPSNAWTPTDLRYVAAGTSLY